MADERELIFEDYISCRQQLRTFCSYNYNSLIRFREGISFKLDEAEVLTKPGARNLTTSATCIESLLECPELFRVGTQSELLQLAEQFSLAALKRPQDEWLSEQSARIYCRCRTLPVVVDHLPEYSDELRKHLEEVLWQLT